MKEVLSAQKTRGFDYNNHKLANFIKKKNFNGVKKERWQKTYFNIKKNQYCASDGNQKPIYDCKCHFYKITGYKRNTAK